MCRLVSRYSFPGKKKKKNLKKDKMRWEQEELFHIINQIKKKNLLRWLWYIFRVYIYIYPAFTLGNPTAP